MSADREKYSPARGVPHESDRQNRWCGRLNLPPESGIHPRASPAEDRSTGYSHQSVRLFRHRAFPISGGFSLADLSLSERKDKINGNRKNFYLF
ncbi:hypothetical protein CLOSYM_02268 [[Clostridium] symbiosum ATCC 14940]|uniref:Uncharacterized protein n=1 Tax=[Clostridium] symbiosum ATCC 14940 TaxID=411472 RepID=A0ABC9TXX0_CLOSY|nr:hypothetical protein CLOSYM_02268 [[Clostridium] symbiosum ATCC 14940]